MKQIQSALLILLSTGILYAQRDFTPSSKKDAFGSRDFRSLRNFGLQFQIGPTFLLTKLHTKEIDVATTTDGFRGNYQHDPFGRPGAYAEIGLFHFPKKRSKLSEKLNFIFISYYDWGLGFKYFTGGENLHVNFIDAGGVKVSEQEERYLFGNGHVYGRFSIHKNIYFGEKNNIFLDNSLGINLDYRVLSQTSAYSWLPMTNQSAFYDPFVAQLHYGLGVGFKLKRGSYLIPGVRTPILGYQSTTGGSGKGQVIGAPALRWFSSSYWPLLVHVKYMFLFEKKQKKGCPPVEVNDQDKNTNKGRQ